MSVKNSTVILARVSSKSQEDEGYSLDSQLKLLQNYCKSNDLSVVKIYKIAETASKKQSRKVFNELLTYINENKVYNLAVEKTDRLTRNIKDAAAIDDWLDDDADRMLHAVKENIKLHKDSKSDVKFMWSIHLAVAKKYTDNLREEAMKGWAEKLSQGWMPSRPPIGYMSSISNGKKIHIPDPKTSAIIRKVFNLYLQPAESTITIWAFLKQSGVTTYNGRPLAKSAVHTLLTNPYYMGIISFNGETYKGSHKPLITKQLFDSVQAKLHNGRPSKRRKHDILLRNVITCGHCGKVVTWQKQKGHLYGACQRDLPTCKQNKMMREEYVYSIIADKLKDIISPSPKIVKWLVDHLNSAHRANTQSVEGYQESIQARINKLEHMEEMLYDDKLSGEITQERYNTKKTDIRKQIEDLSDDLLVSDATVEQKHRDAIDLIELTQTAYDQYLNSDLSNDAKRTVLTKLFDEIVYANNTVSVKYSFLANSIAEKVKITKEIMEDKAMLNQTNKKDLTNRGQNAENFNQELLFSAWQGQ